MADSKPNATFGYFADPCRSASDRHLKAFSPPLPNVHETTVDYTMVGSVFASRADFQKSTWLNPYNWQMMPEAPQN
jgi:hypothetical protein